MGRPDTRVTVNVEIPRDLVPDTDVSNLGLELRRLWAVEQVRLQHLGVGKAAEVAEMSRAAFMALLGDHGVPVISHSLEDLREEFDATSQE